MNIEITGAENIALTSNGKVVALIEIKRYPNGQIDFTGRAVNLSPYASSEFICNGFAGGSSITATDLNEIISAENFRAALEAAKK